MDNPPTPGIRKPSLARFKGLPPWAYIAAIGIGGGAIWYGIHRSTANAVTNAADVSGVDPSGGTLSATTAGDAYPSGSQGAGYYPSDPTTGVNDPRNEFDDFANLLSIIGYPGGGGTQSSAAPDDHYTPPAITVNIPPVATPVQTAPAAPARAPDGGTVKKPDPCVGEYPFVQDGGPRKGLCYKVITKDGKRYRYYKNGDKVLA